MITLAERIALRDAFMAYAVENSDDLYHQSVDCPQVRDALVGRTMPHPTIDGVTVTVEDAFTAYLYYVELDYCYTDPTTGDTAYGRVYLVRDEET